MMQMYKINGCASNYYYSSDVAGRLFPMLGSFNSLSAGIVYGHFKTPMSTMLGLAEHLLNNLAKKKNGQKSSCHEPFIQKWCEIRVCASLE